MTSTRMTSDDKKASREQLRSLRIDLKVWTLKAPGLHFDQTIVCPTHRGRLRNGEPLLCEDGKRGMCEGCGTTLDRHDRASEVRDEIRALAERLNGAPTPEPDTTRKATVTTGAGEQLVMFV
ncbi:hypothetical protein [Streptomyces sp. PH10-H1]|uniref:hypothetical protein n=1 Tax=Streptomyces sp. PH10-H1 TaxID=3046212 RepID=UPI0024BA2B30|nr:hypothetical protein [Streptomyces sp. PH10-H1]MDJ0341779.1 hypothetical protein [Streptomyces sp. PH10-H1]